MPCLPEPNSVRMNWAASRVRFAGLRPPLTQPNSSERSQIDDSDHTSSALAYGLNRRLGESHDVACPSALIGASNFFELAVAAAISLFGFESGAVLATVVGVLIEVPVMLLVVRWVNRSKGWYERGLPAAQ